MADKQPVQREGVYFAYFIYEEVPAGDVAPAGGQEGPHRNLAGQASASVSDTALTDPHVVLSGSITFKNSNGYLNAEQRPFIPFYIAMSFLYGAILAYWLLSMKRFESHLISLHYYILTIILVTLIEAVFKACLYGYMDHYGDSPALYVIFGLFVEIMRNVFARVITLLVGLGYGILIRTVERY